MNQNKGEPKENNSMLLFWGSARCLKRIAPLQKQNKKKTKNLGPSECMLSLIIGYMEFSFLKLLVTIFGHHFRHELIIPNTRG
jgi:hypothetical protein